MFKFIYSLKKWEGMKTEFHKKYYVFDGLGLMHFETLIEARSYILVKSSLAEKVYNSSKSFYEAILKRYFRVHLSLRFSDSICGQINKLLADCLETFKYISRSTFSQYYLSKIRFIYDSLLNICKMMNIRLLYSSIKHIYDSFFIPYPQYYSKQPKNKAVNIIKSNNYVKKCI